MRSWRFYDHVRTDAAAPARQQRVGTRTMVMSHDGADLAAAWQTIAEVGDQAALRESVAAAFPGSRVEVAVHDGGRFELTLRQPGMLRALRAAELSDGTLRYLLWVAARWRWRSRTARRRSGGQGLLEEPAWQWPGRG